MRKAQNERKHFFHKCVTRSENGDKLTDSESALQNQMERQTDRHAAIESRRWTDRQKDRLVENGV